MRIQDLVYTYVLAYSCSSSARVLLSSRCVGLQRERVPVFVGRVHPSRSRLRLPARLRRRRRRRGERRVRATSAQLALLLRTRHVRLVERDVIGPLREPCERVAGEPRTDADEVHGAFVRSHARERRR